MGLAAFNRQRRQAAEAAKSPKGKPAADGTGAPAAAPAAAKPAAKSPKGKPAADGTGL